MGRFRWSPRALHQRVHTAPPERAWPTSISSRSSPTFRSSRSSRSPGSKTPFPWLAPWSMPACPAPRSRSARPPPRRRSRPSPAPCPGDPRRRRDGPHVAQARGGARGRRPFLVAPGFDPAVVDFALGSAACRSCPACARRPRSAWRWRAGLSLVKLFPAEAAGGVAYLKALARAVRRRALRAHRRHRPRQPGGLPRGRAGRRLRRQLDGQEGPHRGRRRSTPYAGSPRRRARSPARRGPRRSGEQAGESR